MGAYIDRDELLDLYANTDELDISNYDVKVAVIRQNILDMPTIDIVRCGECKHRVIDQDIQSGHICLKRRNNGGLYCEDDDFCSYGERANATQHAQCVESVANVICDGNTYAIKMSKEERENLPYLSGMKVSREIHIDPLVTCGECARRKKNGFCLEHNRYERNDDGFCNYGERRADE